jgi:phospholipase/carboxylesterase
MLNLVHRVRLPTAAGRRAGGSLYPAVVMIHGWQGNETAMAIFERTVPRGVVIVSPRAPLQATSDSYGWFRLDQDESDFRAGLDTLGSFVRALPQAYPVDPARVLLIGFSQGACASYALLLQEPALAFAVAGLSGFLPPLARTWLALGRLAGKHVFAYHGAADGTVPVELARSACVDLSRAGAEVDYHEYEAVGHKLNAHGVRDLTHWLAAQFSPQPGP